LNCFTESLKLRKIGCLIASKANSLFATLKREELEALHRAGQVKSFADGEVVFRAGDPGDGIYLVTEGRVRIAAALGDCGERSLAHVLPGDFFGEMAVLDNEPRSANAIAEGPTSLLFLRREEVLIFLERSPKAAVNLVKEFSRRMRDFNRKFVQEMLQADRLSMVGKFAGSIVHDFKNPLSIISMSAELGTMEGASPEMRNQSGIRIQKQVDRLTSMIRELLEFTRGSHNAELAAMDFSAFMEPLLVDLRLESAPLKVQVIAENEPPPVSVAMNPSRLPNVFFNLVHNATDAMKPDGGKVMFRFKTEGRLLTIEVEDSGTGIPPEMINRLFEPFATFGKTGGTGLGLSICQRVVEDHKGTIRGGNSERGGAMFTITLPIVSDK
jgi:signal transduction histidine kinase